MKAKLLAVTLALLLAASTAVIAQSSTVERVDLDTDTPLVAEGAIDEYAESGSVEREMDRYAMTVAYHDEMDGKDYYSPSMATESGHEWFVVCYEEDVDREFRFYVPSEYFTPMTDEGVESRTSGVTADFEPTSDRKYTAVTMTLDEPGCHVFGVSKVSATVFGHWESSVDRIADVTGAGDWTIPGFTGGAEWQHIDGSKLDSETTVAIEQPRENLTVQYRVSTDGDEMWRPVPEEQSASDPVHTMVREGETGTTYVVSDTTDSPQVRWTTGDTGVTGTSSSVVDDVMAGINETIDDISSILP